MGASGFGGILRARGAAHMTTTPAQRIAFAAAALALIAAFGTAGYVLLEGWPVLDALYMTVTTMTTVGYREVHPLSRAGLVFTMVLIVVGVGGALYLLTQVAELILDRRLRAGLRRRVMERSIGRLSGHIVVCGYGRFGRVVADELRRAGEPVVVVDLSTALEDELATTGLPFVIGTAASDETLERAGVARARAIVVATSSDADNVFITLAARELNPGIQIYARGESDAAARRLERAGACSVTSPFRIGGQRVAASILRPSVVDFLEIGRPRQGGEVDLEEVRVAAGSALVGRAVRDLEAEASGVRVVAVKRAGESMLLAPVAETTIGAGDHVVVIGSRAPLLKLAESAATGR
jgi:voltage-gated potassium channel